MSRSARAPSRSEEHTSELQSLMRISYAVFCLKKNTTYKFYIENMNTLIRTSKVPNNINITTQLNILNQLHPRHITNEQTTPTPHTTHSTDSSPSYFTTTNTLHSTKPTT